MFREGALVQITGLKSDDGLEGKKAQLLSLEGDEWSVMTFDGITGKVPTGAIAPLPSDALTNVDFVIGPRCNDDILAQEMMGELVNKGYCVSTMLTPSSDVAEMLKFADSIKYERVPSEFEPYYMGRDSQEKMHLIDFDAPETPGTILGSPFAQQDADIDATFNALAPYLEDDLGIRVTSRTNLMVRQTFKDEDEEIDFPWPTEPTAAERFSFLSLMKRKKACMMHFLGPLTGSLTLIPKGDGGDEITFPTPPGTRVIFLCDRYMYSHTCAEGATVTMQTWFLGQRPEYQMGDIGGDMEVLGASGSGALPPPGETVAVNGMATLIGGDSKDYLCYWAMFNKAGGDTFVEIPIQRWDWNVYCYTYDMQQATLNGQSYTNHQGYVDGIEYFDAKFFGISNSEAAGMDPNQRKNLEIHYECVAQGGYTLKSLQRSPANIGVFTGVSGSEWSQVPHPSDAAGCGTSEAIIANRVNFALNLKGASQTLNTACSAGLVAMHTGKLYLKYRDTDPLEACSATGINLAYSPAVFIGCCGGQMLSYKGRSFTFDAGADGYGRGEGCCGVYMNMAQYTRDIFALVAGSQANQDGRSASITAPNGPSQEKCIKAAFREASLKPPEVDCFECHGTGTALGDPIEVGAFKRIYNAAPRQHILSVTTSKTNLGHLEGGAGMAGFVKCCLQVMRCEASPNLHLREKNAHLDVEGFPAYMISEGLTCHYDSAYSGVSSFGFGGTNAHAMAYGKNTTTSRGTGQRDFRAAMRDKISSAPPPEILVMGNNPEEWETTGMPSDEDKIGKFFQVEVLEDGKAIWREVVGAAAGSKGERFYLSGSFNNFGMERMEQDDHIRTLFSCNITMGASGEELFNIICDEDPFMCYYPEQPRCTRKACPIIGPEPPPPEGKEEATWCIVGEPGSSYKVEFHCTDKSTSVTWLKTKEDISS
jgi:polyketide synthase-associated protein